MATEEFRVSAVIPATTTAVYDAWINGKKHAAFTGAGAQIDRKVGGRHNVWSGYIHGWNLRLEPGKRIVQSWRTTDFTPPDPDSVIDVRFKKAKGGTEVTIVHSDIPEGLGKGYQEGWLEHYFMPLTAYFSKKPAAKKPAAKKPAAKKPAAKKP
ncbi:MAG: SRPBCC domain-containing protein, partial [Deltaproteobacteria bacterium]